MVISRYSGLALMLNALDVDLDETARLPIPPTQQAGSMRGRRMYPAHLGCAHVSNLANRCEIRPHCHVGDRPLCR